MITRQKKPSTLQKLLQVVKDLFNWLKSSQEVEPGVVSNMRVLSTLVVLNIMGVWTWKCIANPVLVPLDMNLVILIASVLGVKALQSFSEK